MSKGLHTIAIFLLIVSIILPTDGKRVSEADLHKSNGSPRESARSDITSLRSIQNSRRSSKSTQSSGPYHKSKVDKESTQSFPRSIRPSFPIFSPGSEIIVKRSTPDIPTSYNETLKGSTHSNALLTRFKIFAKSSTSSSSLQDPNNSSVANRSTHNHLLTPYNEKLEEESTHSSLLISAPDSKIIKRSTPNSSLQSLNSQVANKSTHLLLTPYNEKLEKRGDRLIACVLNITSAYAKFRTIILIRDDIVLLYEKETRMDPHFLTHTLSTKLIRRLNTSLVLSDTPYLSDYETGFAILYIAKFNLIKVLSKIRSSKYNRFLIIWSSLYCKFKDLDFALAQFWSHQILDVVVLVDWPEHVNVYTYYPTRFINVWDKRLGAFQQRLTSVYNAREKTKNLNLHTLKCMVKTRPPDSVIYNTSSGWVLEGSGGETMKEVQRRMNFTMQIIVPTNLTPLDRFGYDISPGMPQQFHKRLREEDVDMGFGIFSHVIYESPDTEFSRSSSEECFTFAVNSATGVPPSIWSYYTDNFDPWVWTLLVAAVGGFVLAWKSVVCVVVARNLREASLHGGVQNKAKLTKRISRIQGHSSYDLIFLLALSCLLGVSNQPKRSRLVLLLQYLFGIWILFSFILAAAFQTSLGSLLTVQRQTQQIETSREIYEANIRIYGQPQSRRIMNRSVTPDDADKTGKLVESFIVHRGFYDEVIDGIYSNPKIGTFTARRFLLFYSAQHPRLNTTSTIHTFSSCRVQTQASPFLFRKGSPLAPRINQIVATMVESGIASLWFNEATPARKGGLGLRDPVSRLEVRHVRGALTIWAGGMALAGVVLGVEIWVAGRRKRELTV
ncbi:hypothetical protein M8J77_001800 [Diaphorina citri]|nr:hypothetical protein M8J77_001800 [Diaphorina citri]